MALPNILATLTAGNQPLSKIDQNFAALGAIATIPGTVTGTNAIAFTPAALTPTVAAYNQLQAYRFVAAATSSGAVTFQYAALAALAAYKAGIAGPVACGSGDIVIGDCYDAVYDLALNSGAGGLHIYNVVTTAAVKVSFAANKGGVSQTGVVASTPTLLTWSAEEWDFGAYFASNRFTPLVAGIYHFDAAANFSANVVDQSLYEILLYKNGSAYRVGNIIRASGVGDITCTISCDVSMNGTTDYVEVWVFGGGAGNKTIDGDITKTYFDGHYAGQN